MEHHDLSPAHPSSTPVASAPPRRRPRSFVNAPAEQDVARRRGRPSEERLTPLELAAFRVALAELGIAFSAVGDVLGVSTSQTSMVLSGERGLSAPQRMALLALVSPAFHAASLQHSSRSHPSSCDPRIGEDLPDPTNLMHHAPPVQSRVQVDWLALGAGTSLSYRELRDAERRVADALAKGDDRLDPDASCRLRVRRQAADFVTRLGAKDRQFHYCATFEVIDERDGAVSVKVVAA